MNIQARFVFFNLWALREVTPSETFSGFRGRGGPEDSSNWWLGSQLQTPSAMLHPESFSILEMSRGLMKVGILTSDPKKPIKNCSVNFPKRLGWGSSVS